MGWLMAVPMGLTGLIVYLIGWGPLLTFGFALTTTLYMRSCRAAVWRPALVWTLVTIAAGQGGIALGWVYCYLPDSVAQTAGLLGGLGTAMFIRTLGRSAEQREQAQLRFERLFRHNPALMTLSTLPDGRFCEVNDTFLKVLGYTSDEIIGRTPADLHLFTNLQDQYVVADTLRAGDSLAGREMEIRGKDGTCYDGLFSGERFSGQRRQYFLTVMINITRRKTVEKQGHCVVVVEVV